MRRVTVLASVCAAMVLTLACGETRHPIGDECLRDDDCLSDTCANRTCVSAPTIVTGATGSPPDDDPRIPGADAGDG